VRWFVDAMNVIGSRPDGWWRDRDGAAERLVGEVRAWARAAGEEAVTVLDAGPPRLAAADVVIAHRRGRDAADDEIVRLVGSASAAGAGPIRVATSDAALAARVRALGAEVEGARAFRRRLGSIAHVSDEGLRAAVEKMRADRVGEAAIRTFEDYYRQVEAGETGLMPEASIEPVREVADLDELPADPEAERDALQHAVVLRLNGGLGTSMGLTAAKSLLEAKEGHSFLDVIARQVLALREAHDARLPLLLMDSFSTSEDSLAALATYPDLAVDDLPLDFLQNKEPKITVDGLEPVSWPAEPSLEWAPPGHGDLYPALLTSGILERLLAAGFTHAFVANSDNLGAILEPRILAWMRAEGIPFLMEVTDRTEADRKGGHIAIRREDGRFVLRETAQTPEEDLPALQDINLHRYVNTNNLWMDLRALQAALQERDGVLGLPLIRNRKTVDPTDKSSPAVYQLESAMGAAIQVFEDARPLRVPRTRFAPVKTTDDLLALRSDAYVLGEGARVTLAPEREGRVPVISLDGDHFKIMRDFDARFPAGPPSLKACDRFTVEGDVRFGRGVVARGTVTVRQEGDGQRVVEDGAVLEG
jgi:UTP--glucose-1-phosphate uridylyltransferase